MELNEELNVLAVGHNFDVIRDGGGYSVYHRFDTSSTPTRAFYNGGWSYEYVDDGTLDVDSYYALRAYCEEDLPLVLGTSWEPINWELDEVFTNGGKVVARR